MKIKELTKPAAEIYLPCHFGNLKTECFFDTGANSNRIPFNEDTKKFKKIKSTSITGGTGKTIICDKVEVPSIKVGKFIQTPSQATRCPGLKGEHEKVFSLGFPLLEGKKFLLNLKELRFEENASAPPSLKKFVIKKAAYGHWILRIGLNQMQTNAMFDTGAELTVIDKKYVANDPESFVLVGSKKVEDATGAKTNLDLYKAKEIRIGEHTFKNTLVYGADLKPLGQYIGKNPIVLGYNHMRLLKWYFNLKDSTWSVTK